MHVYPLSRVPVTEPWSLEVLVEVGSLEVRTHVELETCLPGEEVEATACAAFYQPGRNTVQLLDFMPTEQDVVVVRYLDRELDEVELTGASTHHRTGRLNPPTRTSADLVVRPMRTGSLCARGTSIRGRRGST